MIINKIKIENFKQYYGEQEIILSTDILNKNVTIINGKNGAGKTNFFTAVNWCLYGEDEVDIGGEIINKNKLKEAPNGSIVSTRVIIDFNHENKHYLISRTYSVWKLNGDVIHSQGPSEFEMYEIDKQTGSQRQVGNPLNTINVIMPSNVRTYFLFDGERIDEFAKVENENEVWEAVRNVLKLKVLERAQRHLEAIEYEYSTDLKKFSTGKLSDLLAKDEHLKNEKEKVIADINVTKEEIKSCDKLIQEIEKRQSEIEEIRILTNERDKVRIERRAKEESLTETKKQLKNNITQSYFIFASNALEKAEKMLEHRVDEQNLDISTLKQLYKNIIKSQKCICGREVQYGSKEHKYIMDQIPSHGNEEKGFKVLNTIYNQIKIGRQTAIETLEDIRNNYLKKREIETDIEILEQKEDEINSKLSDSDLEDVSKLQKNRDSYIIKKTQLIESLKGLEHRLDEINRELKDLNEQIEKEQSTEKQVSDLMKRRALSQKCAKAIEELYNNFKLDMRTKIEEKASEIFQTLIRKKHSFQGVALNDNFQLKLVDRFGSEDARSEISAGERQVLSLSFILGLAKISGTQAPLIMDTPFGRLDSDHRRNIIKAIPSLTPQLVLFVTDEELDDYNREMLKDKVKYEYILDYDDTTGNTFIRKVN